MELETGKRRRKLCVSTPYNEQTTGNTSTQYHTETSGSASSTGNVTDMELTMNGMRQELEETKQCLHNISSQASDLLTKYARCNRLLKARDKQIAFLKNRTPRGSSSHLLSLLHALWAVSGTQGATEAFMGASSMNYYSQSQKEDNDSSDSNTMVDDMISAIETVLDQENGEYMSDVLETCIGLLGNVCLNEEGALTVVQKNRDLFLKICSTVESTIMSCPAPTRIFQDQSSNSQESSLLHIFVTSLSNITSHKACCISLVSHSKGIDLIQVLTNLILLASSQTLALRMSAIAYALLTQDKGIFLKTCDADESSRHTLDALVEVMISHSRQSIRIMGRKVEDARRQSCQRNNGSVSAKSRASRHAFCR